jgi:subtilisin family serine protease
MSKNWTTIVLLTLIFALPGSAVSEGLGKPAYVPGEILVKFRSGVLKSTRDTAHSSHGCKLAKRFKRVRVDHVRIPDGWTVEEAVATYRLHADVEYAEPNYCRYAGATIPNDPSFGELWGLDNTGQSGGTPDADIDCPEAWDRQTGDANVVVGVLDSGIDLDHIDLQDNIWRNPGEDWVSGSPGNNGVDDDGNGKTDDYYGWNFVKDDNNPDDDNDHGTHCSGTIGAVGNDGIGISGVNWQVSIMALKMLNSRGSGSVSDEIYAIEYAIDNGVQIISASFSG